MPGMGASRDVFRSGNRGLIELLPSKGRGAQIGVVRAQSIDLGVRIVVRILADKIRAKAVSSHGSPVSHSGGRIQSPQSLEDRVIK